MQGIGSARDAVEATGGASEKDSIETIEHEVLEANPGGGPLWGIGKARSAVETTEHEELESLPDGGRGVKATEV